MNRSTSSLRTAAKIVQRASFLTVLLIAATALAAPPATRSQKPASNSAASTDQPVMRGVFADAFGTQYLDHLSTTRLAQTLHDYEVQRCFLQVCVLGEGYYNSALLPRPSYMPVGYDDPLKDLVATLKGLGSPAVKVDAWITPLQVMNERAIVPPPKGHVAVDHPDWLTKDVEGNKADANGWVYLDPGNPEVQDYVVKIVAEIAKNYDIEGVLIDGLHYPEQGSKFGYNDAALKRYQEETQTKGKPDPLDPKWLDWRRNQVTSLLARITKEVKQQKPDMIVSVTASANGPAPKTAEGFKFSQPYMNHLEDWMTWANLNIPDWIILLDYADEQTEPARFDDWAQFAVNNKGESLMWVGIAGYENWAIDGFRQMQHARLAKADGIVVNNFRQPTRDITTAPDFFAAMRSLTMLSDREVRSGSSSSAALQERLARMTKALEAPQSAPAGTEFAPGVGTTLPTSRAVALASLPTSIPTASAPSKLLPFMTPWDRIYLTNHTSFEGHKIGDMSSESIFETPSGIVIKINNQYIDRIRAAGQ